MRDNGFCVIRGGAWHTPNMPPHKPHLKPPLYLHNWRNSGRMQYAPTEAQFID